MLLFVHVICLQSYIVQSNTRGRNSLPLKPLVSTALLEKPYWNSSPLSVLHGDILASSYNSILIDHLLAILADPQTTHRKLKQKLTTPECCFRLACEGGTGLTTWSAWLSGSDSCSNWYSTTDNIVSIATAVWGETCRIRRTSQKSQQANQSDHNGQTQKIKQMLQTEGEYRCTNVF